MSSIPIQQETYNEPPLYRQTMGFKERLRELRDAAGYSGETLGKLVGVSKQTISHWEKGRYEPNIEQLTKLSTLFSKSTDYLIHGLNTAGIGPEALAVAEQYERLAPSEKVKWRLLLDVAKAGEPEPSSELGASLPGSPLLGDRKKPPGGFKFPQQGAADWKFVSNEEQQKRLKGGKK